MNLGFASFLPPKVVVTMVKQIIENHCGHAVLNFDLEYHVSEKAVNFKTFFDGPENQVPPKYEKDESGKWWRRYKFDDQREISSMAEKYITKYAKEGESLDHVIFNYRDGGENVTMNSYYSVNGEFVHKQSKL